MQFESVKNPCKKSTKGVLCRTKGKTWDVIPGTETLDGYAKIWVQSGKTRHEKYWIKMADLGRTEKIILRLPVETVYKDRRGALA